MPFYKLTNTPQNPIGSEQYVTDKVFIYFYCNRDYEIQSAYIVVLLNDNYNDNVNIMLFELAVSVTEC